MFPNASHVDSVYAAFVTCVLSASYLGTESCRRSARAGMQDTAEQRVLKSDSLKKSQLMLRPFLKTCITWQEKKCLECWMEDGPPYQMTCDCQNGALATLTLEVSSSTRM